MISVSGRLKTGKTTVGAEVLRLIAEIKDTDALGALATEPNNSLALSALDALWRKLDRSKRGRRMEIQRGTSLVTARRLIADMEGGAVLLDSRTALFTVAKQGYVSQSQNWKDAADLPRSGRIDPQAWEIIGLQLDRHTREAADAHKVALVEIHRQGESYGTGGEEVDSVRLRGEAEAGKNAFFGLLVEGGMRSKSRMTGDRGVTVIHDASGRLTGASEELPNIRGPKDLAEVRRRLRSMLLDTLKVVLTLAAEDREAWSATLSSEPPFEFEEAREASSRATAELVVSHINASLRLAGLEGRDAETLAQRTLLLREHFDVSDSSLLDRRPLGVLEAGMVTLGGALRERELRGREIRRYRGLLQRSGLDGRSGEALRGKGQALHEHYLVDVEEDLAGLSSEQLQKGNASFAASQALP